MTGRPGKMRLRDGFRDAALFGRVISAGLAVAGYAFAGVYLARWMEGKGYPGWLVSLTPLGAALFGVWQGWLFLTRLAARSARLSAHTLPHELQEIVAPRGRVHRRGGEIPVGGGTPKRPSPGGEAVDPVDAHEIQQHDDP